MPETLRQIMMLIISNFVQNQVKAKPERRLLIIDEGWLLLEHGYDQAAAVQALLQARGFTQVQGRKDLGGIVRCSGGQWLAGADSRQ